jgi:predicted RNA-binding protein associated with RNAse of E/G family
MRIVADVPDLLALWYPLGTRWQRPVEPPGRRSRTRAQGFAESLGRGDWVFVESEWDAYTLHLLRPGDWHEVRVSWRPDGSVWGWYVNLQRPFVRTSAGIETMDLMLDVLVEPDRSWRLKDEDELDVLVSAGIFDGRTERRVRAEARRVIEAVERWDEPFSDGWHARRPEPLPLPVLPADWRRRGEPR